MIQTILLTALSAQLISKPLVTPTPPTPQVVYSRVLTNKNYVTYSVEQDNTTYSIKLKKTGQTVIIRLPELQKEIASNNKLSQPISVDSTASEVLTVFPTVVPTVTLTAQPTIEPIVSTPIVTQIPQPTESANNSSISDTAIIYLGNCEAGMNPTRNSGNGYYGAFQFSYGTWKSLNTGYDRADLAPIEVQEAAVKQLLQRSNIYNQFPACAQKMHGAGLI